MLAISATGTLTLLEPTTLKHAPSSVPPCLSLTETATSSIWSLDNDVLFLVSTQAIHRYEPSSNSLKNIYAAKNDETISHLLCKDKGTLIYSSTDKVHLLECGSSAKIVRTIDSQKSTVTSISLSNDNTLLSTTASNAVHVHNLTLGSHTVLRGLALNGQTVATSVFHPHARTRLLVGAGKQLMVYDTTRPSGPLKTISLSETVSGGIVAVACSPFSKTLVAVATSGGHVTLIDLEKEKGLFRTLNLKVPLTSLVFSSEGAGLYLGTEHGKLLILDLRALDKPPKATIISVTGCRIETMSIQRKLKGKESNTKTAAVASTSKLDAQPGGGAVRKSAVEKAVTNSSSRTPLSPTKNRAVRQTTTAYPSYRLPSPTSKEFMASAKPTPKKRSEVEKKVFSPVRDPLGNSGGDISVQLGTLGAVKDATKPRVTSPNPINLPISITTAVRENTPTERPPRRARTVPTTARTRTVLPSSSSSSRLAVPPVGTLQPCERIPSRSRTTSSASRADPGAPSASAASISARSTRSNSPASSVSRTSSPRPRPRYVPLPASPTPSPDLPDIDLDVITPLPASSGVTSRTGVAVLGLGTPEVDHWINAGKGEEKGRAGKKGKSVGFKDDSEDGSGSDNDEESGNSEEREQEYEQSLVMQVSPRRQSSSWASSPLNRSSSGATSSAHELLRTIVKDVMYDFQQETRAEMTGLHLDLIRMGRGWKRELREQMQEYASGMNELKEENRRLREENERLRRGF